MRDVLRGNNRLWLRLAIPKPPAYGRRLDVHDSDVEPKERRVKILKPINTQS
ncbi:hypothetical protein E4U46_003948 [Claviceps purpurea]|nr:hypothetical protein E4U46_003948 [Claviceps purpurea]